ncbi:hypothetical protein [Bacillus sp. SM2101]|uniref:hypothetical protein n=1 Tax=Bacillus sp. SM2101 TaxID=2805366 RepID=UPI001BDEE58E|nr:hypothetical protein [Bacillus sp. SM2101]
MTQPKIKQEFTVHADISLPISLKVEAEDSLEAKDKASIALNNFDIQQVMLMLISSKGKVTIPKVYDLESEIVGVYDES